MVKVLPVPFCLLICLLLTQLAYPQVRDTAFVTTAVSNSIAQYTKSMRGQSNLYNGSEYKEPRRTNEQHSYFISEDWLEGTVLYDGDFYGPIPLQYDLIHDALVTELYTNSNPITLVNAKIGGFSIDGHTFRKLFKDTINALPETGYYEVLYDGKTQVVAHRQKSTQQKIEERKIVIDFEERNRYFILYNRRYHAIRSKHAVLNVLKNRQGDIKKFVRTSRLKFKKNKETALRKIAEFYDTPEY